MLIRVVLLVLAVRQVGWHWYWCFDCWGGVSAILVTGWRCWYLCPDSRSGDSGLLTGWAVLVTVDSQLEYGDRFCMVVK